MCRRIDTDLRPSPDPISRTQARSAAQPVRNWRSVSPPGSAEQGIVHVVGRNRIDPPGIRGVRALL